MEATRQEQEIRFTEARGRRVAWARSGEGPPLVLCGWWMGHLELNWRDPLFRGFVEGLGEHRTVVRYDPPGSGVSADGEASAITLEGAVATLAAVVEAATEALDAPAVDLMAGSSGAPIGIALAADRPELVRRLVVYGGYAAGASIANARTRAAMVDLVREHWGLGSRVLADLFMPSADRAQRDAFVAYQRATADAEEAARALAAVYDFDVSGRLAEVRAPTVVLHRREDRAIPFACGRELAAGLRGASFVVLEGADHYPWLGDADAALHADLRALGVRGLGPPPTPSTSAAAPPGEDLTERETEILTLVATGLSDREIAERLVLSPHTIHRHVANIRTKLGLPTRAAAVAAATRRGLL